VDSGNAHTEALKMLARRELSAEGVRARLQDRGFPSDVIESTLARLTESGVVDDRRVAQAYARTAVAVKGRGRMRVIRELQGMGIDSAIVAEAVGQVFGDIDERTLIAKALQKKLRGRPPMKDPREQARLYQYLMRQGFTPAAVAAALRRLRGGRGADQE